MDYFKNISYMTSHIFLMLFFYLFITHRYSRWRTIGICFSTFFILTLTDIFKLTLWPDSHICYFIVTIFQILVTQFTGFFISRTRDSRNFFMSLSASNYVIAGSIAASIFHIYTGNVPLSLVGGFLIHTAILLFLYIRIREICLKNYERESMKNWWELCLIPVFFYTGFTFLAFFPNTLYDIPQNIPGVIIFMITMFVSYVVVLRYLESESENAEIYWKNLMFESHIKGLENQYHLVEQSELNLKILRHDMRHYSSMVDSLLAQGEYEQIKKITEHINEVTDDNKIVRHCSNIILNSILSEMESRARSSDVEIHFDILLPEKLPCNDYELASVLANLLENAITHVKDLEKGKRYADIKIHCGEDHLLVETKNEYEGELVFDPFTGLPKSEKGKHHGLGMQSVSAFSDKIGGDIGCFCEDGIFRILLFAKF